MNKFYDALDYNNWKLKQTRKNIEENKWKIEYYCKKMKHTREELDDINSRVEEIYNLYNVENSSNWDEKYHKNRYRREEWSMKNVPLENIGFYPSTTPYFSEIRDLEEHQQKYANKLYDNQRYLEENLREEKCTLGIIRSMEEAKAIDLEKWIPIFDANMKIELHKQQQGKTNRVKVFKKLLNKCNNTIYNEAILRSYCNHHDIDYARALAQKNAIINFAGRMVVHHATAEEVAPLVV